MTFTPAGADVDTVSSRPRIVILGRDPRTSQHKLGAQPGIATPSSSDPRSRPGMTVESRRVTVFGGSYHSAGAALTIARRLPTSRSSASHTTGVV
jgi:hypothetical protein